MKVQKENAINGRSAELPARVDEGSCEEGRKTTDFGIISKIKARGSNLRKGYYPKKLVLQSPKKRMLYKGAIKDNSNVRNDLLPTQTKGSECLEQALDDEIDRLVTLDSPVLKLEENLATDPDSTSTVKQRLRELGRLMMQSREDTENQSISLEDILDPIRFDVLVGYVKITAEYDAQADTYKNNGLVQNLASALRYLLGMLKIQATRSKNDVKVKQVNECIQTYWLKWYSPVGVCAPAEEGNGKKSAQLVKTDGDGQGQIACTECPANLETTESLKAHFSLPSDAQQTPQYCFSCKVELSTPCSYKAHMRLHDLEEPFTCPDCGVRFGEKKIFLKHVQLECLHYSKLSEYLCPTCPDTFLYPSDQLKHFKDNDEHLRFDGEFSRYKCTECLKVFRSVTAYGQHKSCPSAQCTVEHLCTNCPQVTVFGSLMDFVKHRPRAHPGLEWVPRRSRVYSCYLCTHKTRSEQGFYDHLLQVHGETRIEYMCTSCGTDVESMKMLEFHQELCELIKVKKETSPETPPEVDAKSQKNCSDLPPTDSTDQQNSLVTQHVEKSFNCKTCFVSFSSGDQLRDHWISRKCKRHKGKGIQHDVKKHKRDGRYNDRRWQSGGGSHYNNWWQGTGSNRHDGGWQGTGDYYNDNWWHGEGNHHDYGWQGRGGNHSGFWSRGGNQHNYGWQGGKGYHEDFWWHGEGGNHHNSWWQGESNHYDMRWFQVGGRQVNEWI